MTPALVKFGELSLHVVPDSGRAWLMATKEVARGYGVTEDAIRMVKMRHAEELIEGKHWLSLEFPTPSGAKRMVCWTQRGVVRLGFLGLKSEQAAKFRDWAEDLAVTGGVTDGYGSSQPADLAPFFERITSLLESFERRLRAVESGEAALPPAPLRSGDSSPPSAGDPFHAGDPWFGVHELVQHAAQAIAGVTGEPVSTTAMKLWSEAKKQSGWSRRALRSIPLSQLPLLRGAVQRLVLRAKEDFPDLDLAALGLGGLN